MKRYLPYVLVLVIALLLVVFENDYLYALQDHSLFLRTPLFFEQQMEKPGGLLTWTACFLTQFFYYPILGVGILLLLWMVFMWLCQRTFRLQNTWLTLIPVACLVLTITTLGYWLYFLKLPGHAFCATIGSIVAVALVWGYRTLPRRHHLPSVYIVFAAGLGYLSFGFYALIATALMGIVSWREKYYRSDVFLALTQIIFWPLFGYYCGFHETNIVNIYWAALPVFAHQGERFFAYNIPYIILFASMALMAVKPGIKPSKRLNTGIVAFVAIGLCTFWYKDDNFHRELSMQRNIERQAWEKVLTTAKGAKGEPTRAMCMMQNLALFRLGRTGNEAFLYPNGAARYNVPFSIHAVHTVGKQLYLQYGVLNYCYRWCMEDGVEYGWTAGHLKLMAQCALLNRENMAAQRFLNLLKKTTFHRRWALRYEAMIHRPQLVLHDPALSPILPLLRTDNFLTADQSQLEMFLVEQIVSTPGDTREQQTLANFTMRYYRRNKQQIMER